MHKITRQIVADKIADYLHGKASQAELVDWAERAVMDADFDEADTELLADIVGRLGLADVAEFGLRWQDSEEFLRRLGYRAKVIVSTALMSSVVKIDPEIMSGAPCFAGTRVPIQNLIDYLEGGDSLDEFLEDFPSVARDQIVAFLEEAKTQ